MRVKISYCIIFICLLGLSNCTSTPRFPSTTRTSQPVIPSYPSAVNIKSYVIRHPNGQYIYVTEFETKDPPEAVLTFFQGALQPPAWKVVVLDASKYLLLNNIEACPIYALQVSTTKKKNMTIVELRLNAEQCLGQ
jgi:hypothetical protein